VAFQWFRRWFSRWFLRRPRDRYVFRLIPKAWYKADRPIPFEWLAFKPNDDDDDGVSVYRAELITPGQLDALGRKPGTYYVARLSVQALRSLNLSIVSTAGPLPGHAVIPELRRAAYEVNKQALKELMLELAKLASQDLVLRPTA
jgi:hypothetical protein